MPYWPVAKVGDAVIGVDVHKVVGVPVTPYVGLLFLWWTPKFPMFDVLVNGMPPCTTGAMGYSVHIPQGIPIPETPTNISYWQRWKTNFMMVFTLMMLTVFANIAIALIASLVPNKGEDVDGFIKDVTGIDTTDGLTTCNSIMASFSAFTKWYTWVKLLMPPIPYPGAQGSTAVGNPQVTANGGPITFALCPLLSTSCTDMPFALVPNSVTLGFSNVMVAMDLKAIARGIAVHATQAAIQAGVGKAMGRMHCGCG
jgi:hypothetical protein